MNKLPALILFCFFFYACTSDKEKPAVRLSFKWSAAADSLLHDTLSAGPIVDSLKREVLYSPNDTSAIDRLNELGQNWRGKPNFILVNEALQKSKCINYVYGINDALCHLGIYYHRIPQDTLADSLLNIALSNSKKYGFQKIEALALSWLGGIENSRGNYDEALKDYRQAIKTAEKSKDIKEIAFSMGGIGEVYRSQKKFAEAVDQFESAKTMALKINDQLRVAYCFSNLGDVYREQNDYADALDNFQRAMVIAQKIKEKLRIAYCSSAIGEIYNLQGDYPKALEFFQQAYKVSKEINRKFQISFSLSRIGDIYRSQKKYSSALDYYRQSLKMAEETNSKKQIAFCLNAVGEVYSDQKEELKADENFEAALNIAEKKNYFDVSASCLMNMGELMLRKKKMKDAEQFAVRSLLAARKDDSPNNIMNSSFLLFRIYDMSGNTAKALEMHKLYVVMKDSLGNNEQLKKLASIEFKADEQKLIEKQELEKKIFETEQKKQEQELQQQKLLRNVFVGGSLLLALLAFVIFRSLMQNRKAKAIIERQKELVEDKQKEVLDSIHYAKRIQRSLLPTEKYIDKSLKRLRGK